MSLTPYSSAPLAPVANVAVDRALAGLLSEHSRRAYATDFRDLARYLHPDADAPALGLDDLRQLSFETIAAYRDHLRRERGLSTGTVNRRISAIRKLLQAAVDRGLRPDNPAKTVRGYKSSYKETPALTEDEARRMIAQPDRESVLGLRDYAILQVAIRLGLRREEIAGLRLAMFGQQRGRRVLTVEGKGDKRRLVVLPGDVFDHLTAWLAGMGWTWEDDRPLFVQLKAEGRGAAKRYYAPHPDLPLSVNGLWAVVQRYAKAADIPGITPHALRATMITLALANGAPLQKVQYMAGHSDPRTTERYDRSRQAIDNPASDYIPVL